MPKKLILHYLLSISVIALSLTSLHAVEPDKRPNIIVILTDDMGFSDLGCYGSEIKTPHLDSLAQGGVRFSQFYNTARCCPTRASLLTGLYPHQAGIGHMMDDKGKPGYTGNLNTQCRTIPEMLKPAGYRNYGVGKWHVTRHATADGPKHNWPIARGFDRYYGTIHGAGSYFDPSSLIRDNTMISPFADTEYSPKQYYYTDAIADHAVKYVAEHNQSHKDKPFFLYVAFTAAHWPMHALPEDIAKYRGKYDQGYEPIRKARFEKAAALGLIDPKQAMAGMDDKWNDVKDQKWEAACMEVYAAMIDRMDQGVGKVIAELKRTNQFDNTLIMYMQDNGGCAELQGRNGNNKNHPNIARPEKPTLPMMKPTDFAAAGSVPSQTRDGFPVRMGPKVMPGPDDTYIAYGKGWATVSNTPLREYKHWVHEGGISTPMIAHWPKGMSAKGELRHQPGHLIDIAATCVDLAQAVYPKDSTPLEGKSLRPVFANQMERLDRLGAQSRGNYLFDRDIYWEHEGNRAVRSGPWKLVAKHNTEWELYDLSKDRVESKNMAKQEPNRVKELIAKYEAYAKRANVESWPVGGKK